MCQVLYCLVSELSGVFQRQKTILFIIVLTWSASLWLVVWKLPHSCQTSGILFLYPICEGLLLKFQCSVSWFCSLVLHFSLWSLWLLMLSFMFLKKEQPTFAGWLSGLPSWLSTEHLLITTPKPVVWVLRFVIFLSYVVYCGYIRRRGCFHASDIDVTENSYIGCSLTAGHWRKTGTEVYVTLSFNLVKVRCPAILYFTSRTKTLNYFHVFQCQIYGLYLLSYIY